MSLMSSFVHLRALCGRSLLFFRPEPVSCPPYEDVLEARLGNRHGIDLTRERFDQVGNKPMPVLTLDPHLAFHHIGIYAELRAHFARESLWIFRLQNDDVAANLLFEFCGCAQ